MLWIGKIGKEKLMKKNFIYNILYQVLILILPLITIPYVSRILGADGVGTYSYTYSIVHYFMLIAMLGINNYGNRTIAKSRNNKEEMSKNFLGIYLLQILMSIFMIMIYLVYIFIFNSQYKYIAIIQTLYVISCIFDVNWFFFGIEKFKLTITRNTIIKILSLILIFLFVRRQSDVGIYTLILSGSTLLSNIFLFSFLRKHIKLKKINKKDVLKHIRPCIIMFLPVISVSIYKIMDKIMLGAISSIVEVGYYENAEKIIQVPLTVITALGTVMLPRISNMISANQEEKVKKIITRSMKFVMFLTLPIIFGIISISQEFSVAFFGSEFEKSGILMQYLSITILFLAFGNVIRTQYLIPKERDKEYVISAILGAIINFIINIIFIPKYGAIAACLGTVMAELLVVSYQTFSIRKDLDIKKYIYDSIPFLIKAGIMFFIIHWFNYLSINEIYRIVLKVISAIIIYIVLNIEYINQNIQLKELISKYIRKVVEV